MKHIVSISFTSSAQNMDTRFNFLGEEFRLSHFGADFDIQVMQSLVEKLDGTADVIALQGLHPTIRIGRKTITHTESDRVRSLVKHSLLVTGDILRNVYVPWAVRSFSRKEPNFFKHKRIAFYSGLLDLPLVDTLSQFSERLSFLDPCLHLGLRKELKGLESLMRYGKWVAPFASGKPLSVRIKDTSRKYRFKGLTQADIFVTRSTLLERFTLDHLSGKTLLIDTVTPQLLRQLEEAGVVNVLHFMPEVKGLEDASYLNFATLEAIFQALKKDWEPLTEDEILGWIEQLDLQPSFKILSTNSPRKERKFAFIIHPLSMQDLFRHPAVRPLTPLVKRMEPALEWAASQVPGIAYGKITGVKSMLTGEETEGLIYCILDTPKMMLAKRPEVTYERLIKVCEMAAAAGADIIGLGAYTKIVGDAGITVAKGSPIPVTTGNSLSAAATLWAAREASQKLGFVAAYKSGNVVHAKAMVIGATGSIGAVCAKMLANVVDELVICSRTAGKLLELKAEILEIAPHCKVSVVTNPNKDAETSDLIVTSTSSHDKKVLDIMSVKPGCVICDVSRPLDIREEDALKRPDVLVIESGEIQLPGDVQMSCDMGTPDTVVYACLAETALLALEGRFESFTLSRHISYERVREIYDIAKKHGARLAAIRGHSGLITDSEIELCREHALEALKTWRKA
ncbi:MAG: dehydrogenase [Bdellovibrionota bacterium]